MKRAAPAPYDKPGREVARVMLERRPGWRMTRVVTVAPGGSASAETLRVVQRLLRSGAIR